MLHRLLSEDLVFPDPEGADADGVVAVGGDLRPERVLLAYASGIFPWPVRGLPLMWFSPDPRMLLDFGDVRITRSLRRSLRRPWRRTFDTAFGEVVRACAKVSRHGQRGTWITPKMVAAYEALHALGFAHSVEVWDEDDRLIGGLYGVSIGRMFAGESMFQHVSDASKVAFVTLAAQLDAWEFAFIDCQLHTDHLESLGAQEWPRCEYLARLREVVEAPTRRGAWCIDPALASGALGRASASSGDVGR
jgi:leucyl/phenylalanyl-tRNA--protein transferase